MTIVNRASASSSGTQRVRSRRLFRKLRSLLRSRNTHYSIYCLAQHCTDIRHVHIFRCLPLESPAFQICLDARSRDSHGQAYRAVRTTIVRFLSPTVSVIGLSN